MNVLTLPWLLQLSNQILEGKKKRSHVGVSVLLVAAAKAGKMSEFLQKKPKERDLSQVDFCFCYCNL